MYIFVVFGVFIFVALIALWFIQGEFNSLNLDLAAYGYILVMLGYIISLLKKREKGVDDIVKQVAYAMDKRNKDLRDEIVKTRTLILTLEEGRGRRQPEPESPRETDPAR